MFDLMQAFAILEDIKTTTNEMSVSAFGAFYSVLLEEWCKANEMDVFEMVEVFRNMIIQVNTELGAY